MNTHYVEKTKGEFMKRKGKNISNLKENISRYILENFKQYILVILIFSIGIFTGVMIVNNCSQEVVLQISTYITDFIEKFKSVEKINTPDLIISSIKNNILLAVLLWFAGTTVIGLPVVFLIVFFRGLALGYTISAFTCALGTGKGILFSIIALFLQNIFFIPAILTIGVSSIKLYKSILKDRRKENIKLEIIKHTIISGLMLLILIFSSFIENGVSFMILQKMIKYF